MNTNDEDHKQDALDANLVKLIHKDNLPPAASAEQKKNMLRRLQEKQRTLPQESAPVTPAPMRISPTVVFALAAAVIALLCAVFFFPSVSVQPISVEAPEVIAPSPTPPEPIIDVPEKVVVESIAYDAPDGTRRIDLRDGSTAIAEQGTRFVEVAPRKLRLEAGSLYMLVAKADTPLEVITPQGKALALGTRFLVSSQAADTRVAVAQGTVRLVGTNNDQQVNLLRGEEGVIAPTELIRRPAPRLSHLVEWARGSLRQPEIVEVGGVMRRGMIAIDPQGQESRLSLREYALDVVIENGVARTTMDQTFFNHYHANTEGTFYFPLPPGAAVSRMAMYVNGVRNEAGMVERQRGQEIYNDIKYANRDPALLEQLEGNLYKLRIFPLEGRQEKRIFISFTQSVDELYRSLRYWFPMDHTQEVAGKVRIKVRIKHGVELYDAESSTHEFVSKVDGGDLVLSYEAANTKPDQDLLLKLIPKVKSKQIAETAILERKGKKYLHSRIRLELAGKVDARPRQWFVLNDTSGSRSKADLKAQAHLISRLLAEADDKDQIAIANLNIDTARMTQGLVPLRGEAAKKALEKVRATERIGGTNLAEGLASTRAWITATGAENPHIIYLGDGLASDGVKSSNELTALLDKDIPFIGLAVGKKADLSFLRAAANVTGGVALLMNPDEDLNWRVFDMLSSFNTPRLSDLRWEFPDAPVEISAYADRATLSAGEALTIVAATENALPKQLTLRGKLNGEPWEQKIELAVTREDAGFIPRFWAQRHIEELLKEGEKQREEVVRLSMKHYVATPFTSLIVLENDQMYVKYKVEKGRKDHWATYDAPAKIPVVREPMPWHHWGGGDPRLHAKDQELKLDPTTPEEIIDTLLPSVGPPHSLSRSIYTGIGYRDLGLLDDAVREFSAVLRFDPYNSAARRGLESVRQLESNYYRSSFDETRARMLTQVDDAWQLQVTPGFIGDGGGGGGASRNIHLWAGLAPAAPSKGRGSALRGGYIGSAGFVTQNEFDGYLREVAGEGWQSQLFGTGIVGSYDTRARYGRYRTGPVVYELVGNLATVIPALGTSNSDRASAIEMKLGREKTGSITDEAAALVRAAEAKRKAVRINGVITTPDGRMKGSATTPMYLREETTSDGKSWYHHYGELGLVTRRPVTPSILAVIQSGVPHWPSSLNELEARWAVTLGARNDHSFEIVLISPIDKKEKRVLKISSGGHLLEVRTYTGEELLSTLTYRYEGNVVIIEGDAGDSRRYEAVEVEVADALFVADLEEQVVLEMPLRKPAFYLKQLAAVDDANIAEKKRVLRHLITARLRDARSSYHQGLALAKKEWAQLIQLGGGSSPLFDHRTLAAALDPQSTALKPSKFLTHFKEVVKLGVVPKPQREQVETFIKSWPDSPMVLSLAQRCPDSRVWIPLLELPDFQSAAIEHIAGAAPGQNWTNGIEMANRIADLLIAAAKEGQPRLISKQVASFLSRDLGDENPLFELGKGRWSRVVKAYQAVGDDLASLEQGPVTALFALAIREKDGDLEARALKHLLEVIEERKRPLELLFIAILFSEEQRHKRAVALYQKVLAEIDDPGSALFQEASAAARPIDEKLSIFWLRRALVKLGEENLAANSQLLVQHYTNLLKRALDAKELEVAKEIAIEGYELLPSLHSMITSIAGHYHQEGNDTERWRWLSTIVDRNPKDASAFGAIGAWYDKRDMLMEADAKYKECHSFDSAHPQWLIKRTSALYRAGKFEEADEIYRELIDTKWAPQLKRMVPKEFRIYLADPSKIVRVTSEDPEEGWNEIGFDDQDWAERAGIFGPHHAKDPIWNKPIYLRQKFHVARTPPRVDLQASVHGVECDVYLNGTLVHHLEENGWEENGAGKPYTVTLSKKLLDSLVVGENVISFRCKRIGKKPWGYVELMQIYARP